MKRRYLEVELTDTLWRMNQMSVGKQVWIAITWQ